MRKLLRAMTHHQIWTVRMSLELKPYTLVLQSWQQRVHSFIRFGIFHAALLHLHIALFLYFSLSCFFLPFSTSCHPFLVNCTFHYLQLFSNGMRESEQRHVTLRIHASGKQGIFTGIFILFLSNSLFTFPFYYVSNIVYFLK